MAEDLSGAVPKLEPRFIVNGLIPSLCFSGAVFGLYIAQHRWSDLLYAWRALERETQLVVAVAVVALVLVLAFIIKNNTFGLLRLYEGYWGRKGLTSRLAKLLIRCQQNRATRHALNPGMFFREFFMADPHYLPMRLGNVMRSAEWYPVGERRYCMDALFFWPRLFAVVPEHMRECLAGARSSMELMITLSFLGWVFAVVAILWLALARAPGLAIWLVSIGAAVLVGLLAYRHAIRSALLYGELLRTTVDLYRHDLIRQMGYKVPESLGKERLFWQNLVAVLYYGKPEQPGVLEYRSE